MATITPPPPILLRPDQVADILGIRVATLAAWRRRGQGCSPPYVRLSAIRVAYPQHELERWLTERTATSTADEFARENGR